MPLTESIIPLAALFIPIVGFIMAAIVITVFLFLNYRKRKEMFALYHQERMAAIDKGVELPSIPDAFFGDAGTKRIGSPRDHLLKGMMWTLVGLSLLFALRHFAEDLSWFGLIPTAIGVSHLIYYAVVGRKEAAALDMARKA